MPLASLYNVIIATNQIFLLILTTKQKRTMAAENLLELVEQITNERIHLKKMLDMLLFNYMRLV